MSFSYGSFHGYNLYIITPWEGMSWWFITLPGNDSRCLRGMSTSYESSLDMARKALVAEVANESRSRGSR